ncbi:MAG: cysteine desulfurase family protein [Candidatus Pacearchaeota archaeon]
MKKEIMRKEIFLDNASTTKVNEKVAEKVKESMTNFYANASSLHEPGRKAKNLLEESRKKIANFIGAESSEIVFTSGGTESNNLTLRGLAKANPDKKHIITSVIEHPSILETCEDLKRDGYKIDYIKVDGEGIVDIKELEKKIRNDTLVVSIMHVNNEIGTIQPIEEIGKICKKKKVYFHTDAVQSFKKIDIDVKKMNIDLMSVSAHKIHAPKGVGFLYVKKRVKILPIITGGGQEKNLRSGTENLPGIIGLASAIEIRIDKEEIKKMRNKIMEEILKIPGSKINGSKEKRIYNNINISFYGIEGEGLMLNLEQDGIFVSTGSACASNKLEESHVLRSIKVDEMYIHGSIRITLDEISEGECNFVSEKIREAVSKLRKISPFKLNLREMPYEK